MVGLRLGRLEGVVCRLEITNFLLNEIQILIFSMELHHDWLDSIELLLILLFQFLEGILIAILIFLECFVEFTHLSFISGLHVLK